MNDRGPRTAGDASRTATLGAAIGTGVVLITSLIGADWRSGQSLVLLVPFVIWSLVPYAGLWLLARLPLRRWVVAGAAAAAIAADIGIRLSVFVFPRGSTAAVALVFSPAFLLVICLPAGALLGFVVDRAFASGRRWLGVVATLAGVAVLSLVSLGFARPDLFPTTVYARRQALTRIGPPGVRAGGDRFATRSVSVASAWRLTGEFDGVPGDEIAIVTGSAAQLLDGQTLVEKASLPLAGEAARWNWFSQLARLDGRLVRVDGGGGFQDTRVWELDGTKLFDYRPDAALPPTALRAADLDADGQLEFYATTMKALVRLDASGREVWRQPLIGASIAAVAPVSTQVGSGARATGGAPALAEPAWIVTVENGSGVTVWGSDGKGLGSLPASGDDDDPGRFVLGVVDWLGRRLVAYGGRALTLRALDGSTVFEWTVADMSIASVVAVRPSALDTSLLAVVAAADRDTHRYRLQLLDAARTILYDEVTDTMPQLMTAVGADGATTLLLSGTDLRQLAPSR